MEGVSSDLDPDMEVVVPTGGGTKYHRPNGLGGFETECKTEFTQEVRTVALSEAIEEGFAPCGVCFQTRGSQGLTTAI